MRGRHIVLLVTLLSCISCLTDDNSYKTPQAAITSFTLGYYKVKFHDRNIQGHDTLVYIREGGVMYPMTIDQVNNRIYNIDSLAYGSDISRVTSSVYGIGTIGYKYLDDPDDVLYLWRSYDSIDFTRKLQFVVVSTDETYTRTYDVEVNVRKVFPDSLLWKASDSIGFPVLSEIVSAVRNDSVFCFGADTTGAPSVSWRSITEGDWNGANHMNGFAADGWSHRITVCNGMFYTVSGGSLFSSADALNWNSVKSGIKSLIVSGEDNGVLWALSEDGNIVKSEDMTEWTVIQNIPEDFPDSAAVIFSYPLATNASLSRSVVVGLANDSLYASVWTILSGDTLWTKVDVPAKKELRLPAAASLTVFRYDGALFSLGQGFESFRQSNDNGITWYKCDSYFEDYSSWNNYMQLPSALNGCNSGFTIATDSKGYLWIMTDDGQVWHGAITRLKKN